MAYCPHCKRRYDEDNETQPCCGSCGHPISCGCSGGHSHRRPSSFSPGRPPLNGSGTGNSDNGTGGPENGTNGNGERPGRDDDSEDGDESGAFNPDGNLPF